MDLLHKHIEALIFCAAEPISLDEIQTCLSEMFEQELATELLMEALDTLKNRYEDDSHVFQIMHVGGGFRFLTKPAYQASISLLLKQKSKKKLSTSALETLAIIAYKQPITKAEIEQIRGVASDYAMQKLLEKELVKMVGKSDGPGRPMLYATSEKFMEYFGINDLRELPDLKEFVSMENSIGETKE